MRTLLFFLFLSAPVVFSTSGCSSIPGKKNTDSGKENDLGSRTLTYDDLIHGDYQHYITKYHLNPDYVLFLDFSVHSGRKRLFLLDLKRHRILRRMMVSHGINSGDGEGHAVSFSNEPGSHQSSLGYAIVSRRDHSNWGTHVKYWLKGLSPTNSNMTRRLVVLHSYEMVPDEETWPDPIIPSEGCVMISTKDMTFLDRFIRELDNKKVLLHTTDRGH